MLKMKPILHLLFASLLLLATQVSAQTALVTQFTASTTTPALGAVVTVDFKVTNFTNIISFTIPKLGYNATILLLDSVKQAIFPGFCPVLTGAC